MSGDEALVHLDDVVERVAQVIYRERDGYWPNGRRSTASSPPRT